ncbi:YhcN/YlaJ family sporulation lipoprotein [Bacillus sp. B15-48]|uniref:YhcN/YlaJ family sporulation lipoprotein n=1 Tax=Bacillus sp. B15-48 TaxID=1548601 RepID=UPI00193ECE30|nr:YhcN/YlaJ family sporulation lipoprotein [Bacillus sp. B15-48]MBM4764072.1 YhcN/YlaJ family sporulation lipoprotein [Bacillus sp. B15-48]
MMKNILTLLLCIAIVSGCGANQDAAQGDREDRVNVQNTSAEDVDRKASESRARYLAQLAASIPDVENATAIVIGNIAVVGIDVNEDLDRSDVGSIKYSVTESMRHDPDGANAIVLADPDLTARLREVTEDFRNGQPLQGIISELADITGRIMPMIPADNLEPQPKEPTEKPNEQLNNNEEQKLDNTQDRQSNYHKNN